MNSTERREVRYQRRKSKRKQTHRELSFKEVFTFENLWKSHKKSIKGVSWKGSVQNYRNFAISNISKVYHELHNKTFKSKGFYEFDIIERGKLRHIRSIHISERVVQRCLCDYSLIPCLTRHLIYDNGACIKDKGIDFSLDRLNKHLEDYFKDMGDNKGYALMLDFSKYFDNIVHIILILLLKEVITDEDIIALTSMLIKDFGEKGLGLGSQISQICALFYPSKVDKFSKEVLKIKAYGRYADDTYLIHKDKKYLKECLEKLKVQFDKLGIKLNPKKTQIVKLENGIPWLKMRYVLSNRGKVYRKPNKGNIVRMRRKLKIFKRWLCEGTFSIENVNTSYNSWRGHMQKSNSHRTLRSMDKLYEEVFDGSYN